jgi:hypothetical protein
MFVKINPEQRIRIEEIECVSEIEEKIVFCRSGRVYIVDEDRWPTLMQALETENLIRVNQVSG